MIQAIWELLWWTIKLTFGIGVIITIGTYLLYVQGESSEQRGSTSPARETTHRPTICREYYNDGTDRWKDCMGVGYK